MKNLELNKLEILNWLRSIASKLEDEIDIKQNGSNYKGRFEELTKKKDHLYHLKQTTLKIEKTKNELVWELTENEIDTSHEKDPNVSGYTIIIPTNPNGNGFYPPIDMRIIQNLIRYQYQFKRKSK